MLAKPAPKVSFTSDIETHFCGTANRDTLSNSRLHRIVVWERQWDEITTHIISHFRRESWQSLQLLCFEREFSDWDAKLHRFIKWRQGSLDNGAGAVVTLYKSLKKGPIIRKKSIFCPVILYLLQSIKTLRWYEMKQWTLCLLVSEGVKWKTSQVANTLAVCVLFVCVRCSGCGAVMCAFPVYGECWRGEDHLHFHLRCFFSGASSITRLGSL